MKIYISGKITGIEKQAAKMFAFAEFKLSLKGYEVVNPMEIEHDHDKSWLSYMRVCIKALLDCDAIYLLKNWKESRGAKFELKMARFFNMEVIYE